jgi:tetratricopeptide (TPR) repeat protein
MKYLKDQAYVDADGGEDLAEPLALVEGRAAALRERLAELGPADEAARAETLLELARALAQLGQRTEAWDAAREAFDLYMAREDWEGAVQCCDVMFAVDQPQSLAALGQGIWLAVTYPIDPELSVAMLQHVINETPPDSDGAAVAATAAHYLVDLRAPEGKQREDLLFYTNQLLATVARRHSDVHTQEEFDAWFRRLELHDPAKFLPRLRNIVDVLVQDDWWFDRETLQAKLPVQ